MRKLAMLAGMIGARLIYRRGGTMYLLLSK
jgi:hypothetical protein